MTRRQRLALAWSGLLLGPIAWAASVQLGQALPHPECGGSFPASATVAGLATLLSLLGSALSWRVSGIRRDEEGWVGFLGSLGVLMGMSVGFALLLQAMAGLLVSPCAR